MCANTSCPFSNSTLNIAFGNFSIKIDDGCPPTYLVIEARDGFHIVGKTMNSDNKQYVNITNIEGKCTKGIEKTV